MEQATTAASKITGDTIRARIPLGPRRKQGGFQQPRTTRTGMPERGVTFGRAGLALCVQKLGLLEELNS